MRYFVYILIDPDSNIPFYVGMSDKNRKHGGFRPADHLIEAKQNKTGNLLKIRKIQKILKQGKEPKVDIVFQTNSPNEVIEKEIELIRKIGRIKLKTGPLTNLTDGGGGLLNPSNETRSKMSKAKKGKSYEERYGDKKAEELKLLLSSIMTERNKNVKGKTIDELFGREKANSIRLRLSNAATGKESWAKGLTKETNESIKSTSEKLSGINEGKSYEEIHGNEKGSEIRKKKSKTNIERGITPPNAKGKKRSEEWKRKHSKFWSGKRKPLDQREKISASLKEYHKRKKEQNVNS